MIGLKPYTNSANGNSLGLLRARAGSDWEVGKWLIGNRPAELIGPQ